MSAPVGFVLVPYQPPGLGLAVFETWVQRHFIR